MPRIQIVYEPDPTSSATSDSASFPKKPVEGSVNVPSTDVPKTITARGLAKLEETKRAAIPGKKCSSFADFEVMREELLNTGELWCDPDFPAEYSSAFTRRTDLHFEWKRPKEISENPQFVKGGFNRCDVVQGRLGNCWFLAAVASLTMHDDLFSKVVHKNQDFGEKYCGAFCFSFWRFGQWKEVVVDDRLPYFDGKLLFMHSVERDEFWSALLEKAYVKIFGSYEALAGGSQAEAMEDFTGGVTEVINFTTPDSKSNKTLDLMLKSDKQCSLMGCTIESEEVEGQLKNGLYTGHAYSVTAVRKIRYKDEDIGLVRIRNPWGEREWNGAWSDNSAEWKNFSEEEKERLDLKMSNDGEFWMSFNDFVNNFTKIEICHLGPESLGVDKLSGTNKRRWEECFEQGSWQKNVNAGGCKKFINTFPSNTQFRVKVVDADEEDDENLGTVMIGLMQKDQRKKNLPYHYIGYAIYAIKESKPQPLGKMFFRMSVPVANSIFTNEREVFGRHRLPPGNYLIIPSTVEPDLEGSFILRILSERPCKSNEVDSKNTYNETLRTISGKPEVVSTIKQKELTEDQRREQALQSAFLAFAGPSGSIHAAHLKDLLNATVKKEISLFSGFNLEVCRSLVALYDANQTGKVEFGEFQELWRDLRIWKNVFNEHDYDKSGNFSAYELRQALESSGFKINNALQSTLANRYTDPESGTISFEDFVLCVIRLRTSFEILKHCTKDSSGHPVFEVDEFLRGAVYL